MYIFQLILFLLMEVHVSEAFQCPRDFVPLHKKCYLFSKTSTYSWAQASNACRSMGAQLVSIETAEESREINLYILHNFDFARFWTSGTDVETEGHFKWMVKRKDFTFTRWCLGQPDNHGKGEHCVELLQRNHKACWNDRLCNLESAGDWMYFICEGNGALSNEFKLSWLQIGIYYAVILCIKYSM